MKRVLILSLKENSTYITRVQSMLSAHHVQISLVNETEPKSLSTKMDLLNNCDVVVILATLKLQRNLVSNCVGASAVSRCSNWPKLHNIQRI